MGNINRKRQMALNGVAVLFTTLVNIVLGMVEVKCLLANYGSTVNGLMQTGNQLLAYVSLIESGIGASYLYSMYQPMADKDNKRLSAFYNGFSKNMTFVVMKMLVVAIVLSLIYPMLLKKNTLSYGYMASIFALLSIKNILPYLVTIVPKTMIILKEQRYKAEFISGICKALTYILEIVLMLYTNFPLQSLLVLCIVIAVVTGSIYQEVMKRLYLGMLHKDISPDMSPKTMSKNVLVHNVSGLVFNSTDNIIISLAGHLSDVTIYSNYNLIVSQVSQIAQSFFDGASASMGIKIANKDENSYSVYRQMLTGSLFLGSIIVPIFIVMINDFVSLWVGNEYTITVVNVILFSLVMFSGMVFPCLVVARNAKGLYKESKNFTILQSIVNLGLTIILVPFLGITGALIGTVVARLVITIPCNYILVEKKVFAMKKTKIWELVFSVMFVLVDAYACYVIKKTIAPFVMFNNRWIIFMLNAFLVCTITSIATVLYFSLTNKDFARLINRVLVVIKKL